MKKIILFILIVFYSFYIPSLQAKIVDHSVHATTHVVRKVLFVIAMDTEAQPIIQALNLKKSSHAFLGQMQGYVGEYHHIAIFLIENGTDAKYHVQNVGTQAATLATYLGMEYFHPDLIISIGTAGGIAENGAKIGDIYISQKIDFYDRRIPLPGYTEYGIGDYTSANFDQIINKMDIKKGIICSGDSFDKNKIDSKIILANHCEVREMEAAGVAWVSALANIPMFAMKGITDIVGSKNGAKDFEKNFSQVTHKLADTVKDFLYKLS